MAPLKRVAGALAAVAAIGACIHLLGGPGRAQTLGDSAPGYCGNASSRGNPASAACWTKRQPAWGHAYERWQDGSRAESSGSSAPNYDLPTRGYSSVHDFGR